ncbi:MAG: hypothetical protein IJK78_03335 [Bacteroidales bacterium]|nr:hypothetical protein [Bacteroidales bacterium]
MGRALEIVQVGVSMVVKARAINLVKVIVVWFVGLVVSLVAQVVAVCHAKELVIFQLHRN